MDETIKISNENIFIKKIYINDFILNKKFVDTSLKDVIKNVLINKFNNNIFKKINSGLFVGKFKDSNKYISAYQNYIDYMLAGHKIDNYILRKPEDFIELISRIFNKNIIIVDLKKNELSCHSFYKNINICQKCKQIVKNNPNHNVKEANFGITKPTHCFKCKNQQMKLLNFEKFIFIEKQIDGKMLLVVLKSKSKKSFKLYSNFDNAPINDDYFHLQTLKIKLQCQNNLKTNYKVSWNKVPLYNDLNLSKIHIRNQILKTGTIRNLPPVVPKFQIINNTGYCIGILATTDEQNLYHIPFYPKLPFSDLPFVDIQNNKFIDLDNLQIKIASCKDTIKFYNKYFKSINSFQIKFKFKNSLLLNCSEFVFTSDNCDPSNKQQTTKLEKIFLESKHHSSKNNLKLITSNENLKLKKSDRLIFDDKNKDYNSAYRVDNNSIIKFKLANPITLKEKMTKYKSYNIKSAYKYEFQDDYDNFNINYDSLKMSFPEKEAWTLQSQQLEKYSM